MLSTYGAGTSYSDARSYAPAHGLQRQIIFVDPNNISYYQANGYSSIGSNGHAIAIEGYNYDPSGSITGYKVYDPESNARFNISSYESSTQNGSYLVF